MSVRKLSVQEISEVAAVLNDKEAIGLLKKIRDSVIQQEDTEGKKNEGNANFLGFAKGNEVASDENQKPSLTKLVDLGLVITGVNINNKSGEQQQKYQITETGLSLLSAVGESQSNEQEKP